MFAGFVAAHKSKDVLESYEVREARVGQAVVRSECECVGSAKADEYRLDPWVWAA